MKLQPKITLELILIFICCAQGSSSQTGLFKIYKLNLIWSKAQHSLGPGKLKDLKTDLIKHETEELLLKRMKSHNQDKDGMFEASVRKKLLSILRKYSLERYYDDIHPPVDREHDFKQRNLKKGTLDAPNSSKLTFRDKKLDKLWKKAEQTGFTQEQLMVLHEELQHHQDKIDDHYETMNELDHRSDKDSNNANSENSIENDSDGALRKRPSPASKFQESESEKKTRLESNTQQALREKHSEIKRDLDKIHRDVIAAKLNHDGPFEESHVNELWVAATKGNFSKNELESLREELKHYETRMKKLQHFQAQLERDEIIIKKGVSSREEDDNETKHIKKRVKELTAKVDKTRRGIEQRIYNKRDDL